MLGNTCSHRPPSPNFQGYNPQIKLKEALESKPSRPMQNNHLHMPISLPTILPHLSHYLPSVLLTYLSTYILTAYIAYLITYDT
jgi:hypothetical protein